MNFFIFIVKRLRVLFDINTNILHQNIIYLILISMLLNLIYLYYSDLTLISMFTINIII